MNRKKELVEKLNKSSFLYFWYYILIWLEFGDVEKAKIDVQLSSFSSEERAREEAERLAAQLAKSRNSSVAVVPDIFMRSGGLGECTPPALRRQTGFKVRNSEGQESYKSRDSLDMTDVIIGYLIYDALTDNITETPIDSIVASEWEGYGESDAGGAGAGGDWTEENYS